MTGRRVLLVIDFFNPDGFRQAPGLAKPALAAARCTARLKRALRKQRAPAIYAGHLLYVLGEQLGRVVSTAGPLEQQLGADVEAATVYFGSD